MLNGIEQIAIDDRLMFARMNLSPVDHVAGIEAVLEQVRERAHHEPLC